MALFFVGYLIAVTSTIAFIVAILTPRWIYPNNSTYDPPSPRDTNYRGIFFSDAGYANETCRDWTLLYKDSISTCRPGRLNICKSPLKSFVLVYAIACASLSIAGSALSVILLWFAGGYLYIRRRRLAPNFVSIIAALTLLICKSLRLKFTQKQFSFSL